MGKYPLGSLMVIGSGGKCRCPGGDRGLVSGIAVCGYYLGQKINVNFFFVKKKVVNV